MNGHYTQELIDGNLTFLLASNSAFIPTGFKVLAAYEDDCLVKCVKYRYNGLIKLMYLTEEYGSLASFANLLSESNFMSIAIDLLTSILSVRGNGFLDPTHLLVTPDTLFIDRKTLSVHLIYLPISFGEQERDIAAFEGSLRHMLKTLIDTTPALATPALRQVAAEFMNPTADFPSLLSYLRAATPGLSGASAHPLPTSASAPGAAPAEYPVKPVQQYSPPASAQPASAQPQPMGAPAQPASAQSASAQPQPMGAPVQPASAQPPPSPPPKTAYLSALNAPVDTVFAISNSEYIIGRSQGRVHGVIPSSKVSRQHCKVLISTGGFYVCDLESANGTFLNGAPVAANKPELLRDGDILKLADVEFKVTI
jgi:hypothetical protein